MKRKIIGTFIALLSTFWYARAEFFYPIQEMSKPECRFQEFSTLGAECKQQLPILKTADYTKYKNDYSVFRRVYTILWGSSYTYGWDIWYGGHSWVDIATAKGTPVYAMTSGKVVFAGNLAWRGNTVKIEHDHNGKKIYSNYSHLSAISVSQWDKVTAKQKVGEVGTTWNSTGNHLHFQIDVALSGKGPRYRSNCSEKNYDKIVNEGKCFDQLAINTVDPLRFLETNGSIVSGGVVVEKPKPDVINPETILSREEILQREIADFLKSYDVKVSVLGVGGNIELGKPWTFRITVTDKRTKRPFNGSFPWDMNFKYNKNAFDIFPTWILQIDRWLRDFKLTPKIEGKNSLEIYFGETFFKRVQFGVFNTKKAIIPKSVVFWVKKNAVIGENKKWLLYFKDNYWVNILGFPFSGNFTLTSPSKNIKFCIKRAKNLSELERQYNTNCKDEFFAFEQVIKASDSVSGIVIFEYKVLNEGVNTLKVTSNSTYKDIGTYKFNGTFPLDVKNTHSYYEDIINISKKWISSGISSGYYQPDKDLTTENAVNMIKNYLEYKIIWCGKNQACKSPFESYLIWVWKVENSKFTYISRIEFLEMVEKYALSWEYWGKWYDFRDLSETQKNTVKNIFKDKTWNDYFGQTRYFQPNKNITRAEAAYVIEMLFQ